MKIKVNKQHEMWIVILKDVTRSERAKEISFGRGKRVDKIGLDEENKNCTHVPVHVIDDTVVMFHKQDTGRVKLHL